MKFNFQPVEKLGGARVVGYPAVYLYKRSCAVYFNSEAIAEATKVHKKPPTHVMMFWDPNNLAIAFFFNSVAGRTRNNFTLSPTTGTTAVKSSAMGLWKEVKDIMEVDSTGRFVGRLEPYQEEGSEPGFITTLIQKETE